MLMFMLVGRLVGWLVDGYWFWSFAKLVISLKIKMSFYPALQFIDD